MGSRYVQEIAASSSDSGSHSEMSIDSSEPSNNALAGEHQLAVTLARCRQELHWPKTSELTTSDSGVALWISCLRAGRAKDSALRREAGRRIQTYGPSSVVRLCERARPGSSSKTSTEHLGPWLTPNSDASVSVQLGIAFARLLWALPIADRARFYWPTPTAKANQHAPSMRKWPAYRRLQDAIPEANPTLSEWMNGRPVGWISSGLPVKAQFRRWLLAHSSLFRDDSP